MVHPHSPDQEEELRGLRVRALELEMLAQDLAKRESLLLDLEAAQMTELASDKANLLSRLEEVRRGHKPNNTDICR
jgi:hypothetical protein